MQNIITLHNSQKCLTIAAVKILGKMPSTSAQKIVPYVKGLTFTFLARSSYGNLQDSTSFVVLLHARKSSISTA